MISFIALNVIILTNRRKERLRAAAGNSSSEASLERIINEVKTKRENEIKSGLQKDTLSKIRKRYTLDTESEYNSSTKGMSSLISFSILFTLDRI